MATEKVELMPHARVFPRTLEHWNSKTEIRQRNKGRRYESGKKHSGHEKSPIDLKGT